MFVRCSKIDVRVIQSSKKWFSTHHYLLDLDDGKTIGMRKGGCMEK